MTPQEPDFEPGHPARFDYDPASPEAIAWARAHYAPKGERDFPVGHLKAADTPGNANKVAVLPGVDPHHPELQAFSGRTPHQVAAIHQLHRVLAAAAQESPVPKPLLAPEPPEPIDRPISPGQPGE